MSERDERLYLTEILNAIDRALRYSANGRAAFFADPMTQDAVVRNIEIGLRSAIAALLAKK
jgi:uncharacterized protein with HEPN domain